MRAVTDETHPIQVSPEALERVAALRLSGLPLATFLALLAKLDSAGRAEITQPELGKLLSTGPGKVWQSLQALVAAGVIEPPIERSGMGRRTPYRIPARIAVAPGVRPRRVSGGTRAHQFVSSSLPRTGNGRSDLIDANKSLETRDAPITRSGTELP